MDAVLHSLGNPEADVLVLAAREAVSEEVRAKYLEAVVRCRRADYFIPLCQANKLTPLVLQSLLQLDGLGSCEFSTTVITSLRKTRRRDWVPRRVKVKRTLDSIHQVFETACVPHAFLRGLRFAEKYYDNPCMRFCLDVDILVPVDYLDDAVVALFDADFVLRGDLLIQNARVELEGKLELLDTKERTVVDLNWCLTGNAGIGRVETDVSAVWDRARSVTAYEHELSPEDAFIELIRHVGHAHSFEQGFIRTCVDVNALLRSSGDDFNWAYVEKTAFASECARVLRFFAHFYDCYWRDETHVALSGKLRRVQNCAGQRECALFARLIQVPLFRWKISPRTSTKPITGNIWLIGKLWAMDRVGRTMMFVARAPWPPRDAVALFTVGSRIRSPWLRRLRYLVNPLIGGVPALFAGLALRVVFHCVYCAANAKKMR